MPRINPTVEFSTGRLGEVECPGCKKAGHMITTSRSTQSNERNKYYLRCTDCGGRATGFKTDAVIYRPRLRGQRDVVQAATLAELRCPSCGRTGTSEKTSGNKKWNDCWRVRCSCSARYDWRSTNPAAARDMDDPAELIPEQPAPRAISGLMRPIDDDEASLIREWLRDAKRQLGLRVGFSNSFEIYDMAAATRLAKIGVVSLPKNGRFGAGVDVDAARRMLVEYDQRRGRM